MFPRDLLAPHQRKITPPQRSFQRPKGENGVYTPFFCRWSAGNTSTTVFPRFPRHFAEAAVDDELRYVVLSVRSPEEPGVTAAIAAAIDTYGGSILTTQGYQIDQGQRYFTDVLIRIDNAGFASLEDWLSTHYVHSSATFLPATGIWTFAGCWPVDEQGDRSLAVTARIMAAKGLSLVFQSQMTLRTPQFGSLMLMQHHAYLVPGGLSVGELDEMAEVLASKYGGHSEFTPGFDFIPAGFDN